jgi:hypothetical protein
MANARRKTMRTKMHDDVDDKDNDGDCSSTEEAAVADDNDNVVVDFALFILVDAATALECKSLLYRLDCLVVAAAAVEVQLQTPARPRQNPSRPASFLRLLGRATKQKSPLQLILLMTSGANAFALLLLLLLLGRLVEGMTSTIISNINRL